MTHSMLAVVSHDAGGAEILSSYLRQNPQPHCLVLDGPAVNVFMRKLGDCQTTSLADAIDQCSLVLCGTSWQSNLEKQAIVQAKAAGKKVIAFIDHWVNYSERFQLDGKTIEPDEIWVGDVDAEILAQQVFPTIKIVLIPNPYFKDLTEDLNKLHSPANLASRFSILYVCEPIREHAMLSFGNERHWGYTEEDALHFFLENTDALVRAISDIKIRPHPSESKSKYDWAKEAYAVVAETTSDKSLVQQIVEADIVVGCNSMALVVALLAKKRVISSIPPGGQGYNLPQAGIEHLQALVSKYQESLDA
ncbi:MAG: hypothetical protein HQ457_05125 [Betaproteobacteria bacterium]|nr:hypothetical protein [Betaproteobacteria bacterium]